jgi:hypothetical protein
MRQSSSKIAQNRFRAVAMLAFPLMALHLSACDTGVQHMGPTEYGVRFRKLPTFLGGGIGGAESVAHPLQTVVVMPWESIIRFDTAPQYLRWGRDAGDTGEPGRVVQQEDVHTRARDGNEAALKIIVRYRTKPSPESLVSLAQNVATSDEQIRQLVISVVRSEIRTYMNKLRTPEFRDDKKRNEMVDETLAAAQKHLEPLGIDVESIALRQYRFVRLLTDGNEDTRYQDRLREIQELEQDIEGERSRIETVRAKKKKELLEAESLFNARLSEAKGFKEQSAYEGNAYYAARENEAKAIAAEGSAQVEGLRQQIAALSGKGAEAMLRLEIAKQLSKSGAKFVAINPGKEKGGASVDLSKTDMNQLLQQLGIAEGIATK